MNKYKALMLDLDGTTIPNRPDGVPSERVTEAVNQASSLLHIGVVTGRPYFSAKPITSHLKLTGPSIVSGGAQVIDVLEDTIHYSQALEKTDIEKIFKETKGLDLLLSDGAKEFPYTPSIDTTSILQLCINEVHPTKVEGILEAVSSPTLITHTVPSWTPGYTAILFNHVKATKQYGIYEVAKVLGIDPSEIIGIGDGGNDMPLLMACGLKVAMGNANDNLKAIADYIAPTVDEDGVAHVIEKFILNS